MDPLLSLVVPIFNVESNLKRQISQTFEILSDLTSQFELILVDDASSDTTEEVALELAAIYPQLHFIRHGHREGTQAAIKTGLQQTKGEFVFVQESDEPLQSNELRRLWELRNDQKLVMARSAPAGQSSSSVKPLEPSLIKRLMTWGKNLQAEASQAGSGAGLQMIRSRAVQEMDENGSLELISRQSGEMSQ